MRFTNSELEMIYQYAAPTQSGNHRRHERNRTRDKDLLTKGNHGERHREAAKDTRAGVQPVYRRTTKPVSLAGHENSIRRRLTGKGTAANHARHDCRAWSCFHPETRHMIVLDVKTS